MIIDHIIGLAEELGVPTDGVCEPTRSRACFILERLEALFLVDPEGYLGERFRKVTERATS